MTGMSDNIELRHLRAMVALSEELHFSRAAAKLHIAQQALSTQIRQLEQEIGVQLFHRTTRRVELSEAGRIFLSHVLPILTSLDIGCEQTRRGAARSVTQVSVAYTTTVAAEALPRIVFEMHRLYPAVKLRMCEMWQEEAVEAVSASRFDLGLARSPEIKPNMHCVSIREEPMGVILGKTHPLAGRGRLTVADLAAETLTIWPRSLSPGFYDLAVDSLRAAGFRGPIREFENLGFGVLFSDAKERIEVAEGRAFSLAFEHQHQAMPAGFAWRCLEPAPLVPLHMFWNRPGDAAALLFAQVALDVARREGWMPGGDEPGASSPTPHRDRIILAPDA